MNKGEVHVVGMQWGDETYSLVFRAENKQEALRTLGRWAGNPELSFQWSHAARLAPCIRKACGETNG